VYLGAAWGLAGCSSTRSTSPASTTSKSSATGWHLARAAPTYKREEVGYLTEESPGPIIVDPPTHYLHLVERGGKAMRYGIGVGGEGYGWSGVAMVNSKQEWPDWYPTTDMLAHQPQLGPRLKQLQGGHGVPGGPENPLSGRALCLWQDNKDTLYRIYGTNESRTIGQNVSSGCIRLINDNVIDLCNRSRVGTKGVVLPSRVI
jgi:lipoprotein-anchoring transpeptidase ErfK/SrfK